MNSKAFILLLGLIMVLFSCQKRDWNNPFDPDCPKESYTPSNFKAEQQGNIVKLTWTQSNSQISGFKIEKKVTGGSWAEVASLEKSITTWNDVNLTGGKLHEYRLYAYASSNLSNVVSAQITPLFAATITTSAISNITSSTATSGGSISSDGGAPITARGVCWGTSQNPTIAGSKTTDGSGTGSFTSAITGLTAGTTYYVRAYATNSVGTAYGSQVNFSTNMVLSLATVTTASVSTYSSTTALLGGNVTSDGNATVTERGVCYSTTQNPTTANSKTALGSGTGSFNITVTGLIANTTYYVRAYAINSQGTAYGDQVNFTTNANVSLPTVITSAVDTYTSTTALLGGNVTSDGNATVTERGVCYSTSQNPTTANNKTAIGSGTGTFSTTNSGLTANTTYYVRAYAINSQGTAYGTQLSFTTSPVISLATVITAVVTTYTSTTAMLGGNVTSDGNAIVTERGVCYSTSQNPTTANNKMAIGSGTGTFSTTVTGLTANTIYYVRAYATNSQGTAYGSQVIFSTTASSSTITDADGNAYNTVTIGTQIWMAENLKTTKYRDGTSIPNVTDNSVWCALSTGAFCYYDNNGANKSTIGALYNWYAISSEKICPYGWHVPRDEDWKQLMVYLGLTTEQANLSDQWRGTDQGNQMKSSSGWNENGNGTNASGFNALPGGFRQGAIGYFGVKGYEGSWWSNTEYQINYAWYIGLTYNKTSIWRGAYGKTSGFSVRCIKD